MHAFARARAVPSATALKSVFILHHHLAGGIERMEEFTLFDRDLRVRAQCPQNVLFRLWSCQALSRRRQSRFDRCGAWDCHARVHRNTLRGPRHFEGGPAPVRRRSARRISVRAGDSGTAPSLFPPVLFSCSARNCSKNGDVAALVSTHIPHPSERTTGGSATT